MPKTEAELDAYGEARIDRLHTPGVRHARICTVCNRREFSRTWKCREHPGKTEVQKNNHYFGRPC